MDFVGPRFIRGYDAISSLNLIDVVRNRVHHEQYDSKSTDNVIGFLIPYWRNNPIPKYLQVDSGMCFIENFNNWFGAKLFWDKETFTSPENIRARSLHFVGQHNNLSAWKKRDKELKNIAPVRLLKNAMGINLDKLPLTDGKIHFIRKVDNKAGINVLNEVFEVGKGFISEYAWATICLGKRKTGVYYRAQDWYAPALIKEFEYDIMTLT